jgi:hypothetical protein
VPAQIVPINALEQGWGGRPNEGGEEEGWEKAPAEIWA